MSARSWFRTHKRQVITHTSIVVGFVLLTVFVAEPLFDKLEAIPNESRLVEFMLPDETGNLYYGIDRFNVSTHLIDMSGWAFIDGQGSDNSTIYIVLKSDKNVYIFDTQPMRRPDVTIAYKSMGLDVDWSGFAAIIPLRKVRRGEYDIGLYIRKGDIQALQYIYIDNVIVKAGNSVELVGRI